jgi:hypothetical protein
MSPVIESKTMAPHKVEPGIDVLIAGLIDETMPGPMGFLPAAQQWHVPAIFYLPIYRADYE